MASMFDMQKSPSAEWAVKSPSYAWLKKSPFMQWPSRAHS